MLMISSETWGYQDGQVRIPSSITLLEQGDLETGGTFRFIEIPTRAVGMKEYADDPEYEETLAGFFDDYGIDDPRFTAILDSDGRIRISCFSDKPVENLLQLRERIHQLTANLLAGDPRERIPVIFDEDAGWLVLPVTEGVKGVIDPSETSPGPSGTHYNISIFNRLVNKLCQGQKIPDIAHWGTLRNCSYYDIRRSVTGELYIDCTAKALPETTVAFLNELGVITSEKVTENIQEGSIPSILRQHFPDLPLYEHGLVRILKKSFREAIRSNVQNWLVSLVGFQDDDLMKLILSTYDHSTGYPCAVVAAYYNGEVEDMNARIAPNHDLAMRMFMGLKPAQEYFAYDAVLRMADPSSLKGPGWDVYCVRQTAIPGEKCVRQGSQKRALKVLETISGSLLQEREKLRQGLVVLPYQTTDM